MSSFVPFPHPSRTRIRHSSGQPLKRNCLRALLIIIRNLLEGARVVDWLARAWAKSLGAF